jgi:hypothetical protein
VRTRRIEILNTPSRYSGRNSASGGSSRTTTAIAQDREPDIPGESVVQRINGFKESLPET